MNTYTLKAAARPLAAAVFRSAPAISGAFVVHTASPHHQSSRSISTGVLLASAGAHLSSTGAHLVRTSSPAVAKPISASYVYPGNNSPAVPYLSTRSTSSDAKPDAGSQGNGNEDKSSQCYSWIDDVCSLPLLFLPRFVRVEPERVI